MAKVKFFKTGLGLDPVSSDPSSPSEGQIQFSDGTHRSQGLWQYKNGSWASIGSGGGGQDVWLSEDFETTSASDFSTGNSATFLGGGVLDGVLSDETVSPIADDRSIKYVAGTSSQNDYFASPVIDLDLKQQANDSGHTFYYNWDGSVEVEAVVYDVTNGKKLTSSLDVIETADGAKRYSSSFTPPSNCTQVRYGFHFVNAPTSGDTLIFDSVEFSVNPFLEGNLSETGIVRAEGNAGTGITADVTNIDWTEVDDTRGAWDGTTYTVQNSNSVILVTGGIFFTSSAGRMCNVYVNGSLYAEAGEFTNDTTHAFAFTFSKGELSAGDLITFRATGGGSLNNANNAYHRLSINESWDSTHIITPAKSTLSDPVEWTPTLDGFGTVSGLNAKWHREGKFMVGRISGESGTPSAVTARFSLPSGYTIDSNDVVDYFTQLGTGKVTTTTTQDISSSVNADWATFPIVANSATHIYITSNLNTDASQRVFIAENASTFLGATEQFTINFKVPIAEWSSDATFLAAVPVQKVAYIKDVKASGVAGGTFTGGSYQTRDLNTIEGDTEIVSLTSNQFTLPKGKYKINFSAPAYSSSNSTLDFHKAKLVKDPNGSPTDALIGTTERNFRLSSGTVLTNRSFGAGIIEITSTEEFELQHRCTTTSTSVGFGQPSNFGDDEVYSIIEITKLR